MQIPRSGKRGQRINVAVILRMPDLEIVRSGSISEWNKLNVEFTAILLLFAILCKKKKWLWMVRTNLFSSRNVDPSLVKSFKTVVSFVIEPKNENRNRTDRFCYELFTWKIKSDNLLDCFIPLTIRGVLSRNFRISGSCFQLRIIYFRCTFLIFINWEINWRCRL